MTKDELIKYGIKVFESENNFLDWVMEPNRALDNKIPYALLYTKDGIEKVRNILGRIEHGIFS